MRTEEFTTFDFEKKLGIQRNLLAQWIMLEYIVPSLTRAKGVGTKNLFSRNDAYKIVLFKKLVETGIRRDEAKYYVNINFEAVGRGTKDKEFAVIYRTDKLSGKDEGVIADIELVKGHPTIARRSDGAWAIVIDLLAIKEEVDRKLG
jgi:hypothetical protein